jgi:hypothetical protein
MRALAAFPESKAMSKGNGYCVMLAMTSQKEDRMLM